ncbi:potassium channel family protein [Catenovulum adriaticum]|uniref:Potassium channel family protein n=1 Tax=Catenovulum adriaticum TaxID=2984846 RepID=A0ABY7AMH3_9ALTE|nr:potassium channel family protein [Catenovulum sp. TS8]WAJ69506.1 potassium channel family protein [Catenovulum sp. TS8]
MMIRRVLRFFQHQISEFSWFLILILLLLHIVLSWLGLYWAGEAQLTHWQIYPYYYVVTTSTVGYGDFSPQTLFGRTWVWLFQIPMGLILFGAFLAKAGQSLTYYFKRSIMGNKNFKHYQNHIILFGYHHKITDDMVKHILADTQREGRRIILCDLTETEHPLLNRAEWVDFAKLNSFTLDSDLERVAASQADRIIIYGQTDDQTLTCALKLSPLVDASCHITAWFDDESKVDLLRSHCPNVECSSSKIAEILVRSMQDPGASRVQEQLLSNLFGDTQYSIQVPVEIEQNMAFQVYFEHFKNIHDATVLAIAKEKNGNFLEVNPPLDTQVMPGDYLHYIGNFRIKSTDVNWKALLE